MTKADPGFVEQYCKHHGFGYLPAWDNPPLSGLLFRSRDRVQFRTVIDARTAETPFLLGCAQARGRGRRKVAVLVMPLRRPVPNMILMSRRNSLFSGLGIALEETQLLNLGGEFGSSFSLYCPNDYEPDALFVFTPDVMAKLVDATGVSDLEFVDDRLLIYASVDTFYTPQRLAQASELVTFLADKIDQQTRFYRDLGSSDETVSDPFRIGQLTSGNSGNLTVSGQGRRIRTRTTGWQKAGITVASLAVLTAGVYWVTMVTSALTPGGN